MGALALLTFLVLCLIPLHRLRAARAGQVGAADFKFGVSATVPGHVSIPNRNYMNLLELPMPFYVAALSFYVSDRVTPLVLATAWSYVGLRALHSAIHLSYNHVIHRLGVFATSNTALVALWLEFFAGGR